MVERLLVSCLVRGETLMTNTNIRRVFLSISDAVMINFMFIIVLYLHYEGSIPIDIFHKYISLSFILTIAKLLIYNQFKLYNSIWEFASIEELIDIVGAVTVGFFLEYVYFITTGLNLYYGVLLLAYFLEIAGISSIRFSYRVLRRFRLRQSVTKRRLNKTVMIVGSGATASMIAREIIEHPEIHGLLIGYIDDDITKQNRIISGVKVIGNQFDIFSIVKRYQVNEIIIALPTESPKEIKELIKVCKRAKAEVKIIPGVREVIGGQVSMSNLQDVGIDELLGREPMEFDLSAAKELIENRTILVTGGGGTIGQELSKKICELSPSKLIIIDFYENDVYSLQNELTMAFPEVELDVIIATIQERDCIYSLMKNNKADVVFHCAGYNNIKMLKSNPMEVIKNNTFGTLNMAEAAGKYGVDHFFCVSTNITNNNMNIFGVSAKINEKILVALNQTDAKTKYTSIRIGKVINTKDSVIQLFKKQINEGGPVTVTHKEIERVFMTISEAVVLILKTSIMAEGGDIFNVDVGKPLRIYNLAYDLIELSGLKPYEDIDIEIVGLRQGEKLQGEIVVADELMPTGVNCIFKAKSDITKFDELREILIQMSEAVDEGNHISFFNLIGAILPTYEMDYDIDGSSKKVASLNSYRKFQVKH